VSFRVIAKDASHDDAVLAAWRTNYNGTTIVSRGKEYDARLLQGFVADEDGKILGALTYHREGDQIEIVSLDSLMENRGVGTALLEAASLFARAQGVRRLWLATTNDNIRAIRFYQRLGWNMAALYPGAVEQSRKIKPSIPLIGEHGIPIQHEIEFEKVLV
jgi:GNAT superfamily N-acetyltransferase